ncbi:MULTISPECIES: SRPBCC domain-containing protein [unclassified Agromyces]|uniref:SRPBCC domain-containing protein n=1 Tax=unclassified Agromyces TaxID=2639701 RepID=UPI003014ED66
MSTTITTTIHIAADPDTVWTVLTDFASYSEWNPFMSRVEGTPEVGSRLVIRLSPAGGRGMTFKPTVLAAAPGRELRWLGKLGFGGLFDGEHFFLLDRDGDGGTRMTHGEKFSGILVSLMGGATKNADDGFDAFNRALKDRAERVTSR